MHKTTEQKGIGNKPDLSSGGKLMDLQPVYIGDEWADQLFLIMTDKGPEKITLRIEVVSASQPLGSAVNIARINTNAKAAYN